MVNKKKFKTILISSLTLLVPGLVVGSYFAMKNSNTFYKYFRSPITDDTQGLISAYLSAVSLGSKVVVAAGFDHYAPIEAAFKQHSDILSDTGFLLLDSATDKDSIASYNTWSVNFRSDLGSFRTGVAAAMFLNENQEFFKSLGAGNELTFGMYGGMPYPSVTSFMGGIQHGIKWFNDNLVGENYKGITLEPIKIINPTSWNFAGGFGASQGDTIIQRYLVQPDIDMLMPVAGPQVWSAQRKIIELNKKTVIVGVDAAIEDSAQNRTLEFTNNGKQIGNGKYVQFSSVKRLDKAVEKALTLINNGNKIPSSASRNDYDQFIDTDGFGGIGTVAIGNIKNGCVGVSGIGQDYYKDALNISGNTVDGTNDPSLSSTLSEKSKMNYYPNFNGTNNDLTGEFNYGDGLAQNFSVNVTDKSKVLNLKNFVEYGNQDDSNLIKIVGSGSTTVLFDSSFNESAYIGIVEWYKKMGITIPKKGKK